MKHQTKLVGMFAFLSILLSSCQTDRSNAGVKVQNSAADWTEEFRCLPQSDTIKPFSEVTIEKHTSDKFRARLVFEQAGGEQTTKEATRSATPLGGDAQITYSYIVESPDTDHLIVTVDPDPFPKPGKIYKGTWNDHTQLLCTASEKIAIFAQDAPNEQLFCSEFDVAPNSEYRFRPIFHYHNLVFTGPWYDEVYCYYLVSRIAQRASRPQGTFLSIKDGNVMFEEEPEQWVQTL